MIPNAYSDILTKNADRQHLNDAVEQFLATGGKVNDLSPPLAAPQPAVKAEPALWSSSTSPASELRREQQGVLAELRNIRAMAATLHRQLDRIEQQLHESPGQQAGEHLATPGPSAQAQIGHSLWT